MWNLLSKSKKLMALDFTSRFQSSFSIKNYSSFFAVNTWISGEYGGNGIEKIRNECDEILPRLYDIENKGS